MEGLIKRAFVIAGVLIASGILINVTRPREYRQKTEDELIAMMPTKVNNMPFMVDHMGTDPRISYKMDPVSYNTLKPFGIVCRIYTDGVKKYDAVVIASRSRDSFHDPRVCFSAQGWTIERFQRAEIKTESRGVVPITLVGMSSSQEKNKLAAFFYRGPRGTFYGSTQGLKWGMFVEKFRGGDDIDGVFYRFIPREGVTEEEFLKFMANFLDAAKESSGGYF